MEINPMEFLYFRQDNPKVPHQVNCKHDKCWQTPFANSDYCTVHWKFFKEKGIQYITSLTQKVKDWPLFIKKVKERATPEDTNVIELGKFTQVLTEMGVVLSPKEKEMLLQGFVENQDRNNPKINVGRIYDIKITKKIRKLYDKVDMYEEQDLTDLVDNSGYFGIFYREKIQLDHITEKELIDVIMKNNKLVSIMKNIKEIDQDNNGYVTNQELDDIFKMHYEKELKTKDLKTFFKVFASLQNRILIDYKKVRDYLLKKVEERENDPL
mmetsp:Transcript_12643/g.12451  ORF Transcript_12643/g.12451 Transcript_12643/m.12451 type:complete len:268 (+) Transcript_12643:762-1565(+)